MIKFYKQCSNYYDCLNLRVELEYLYPGISMGGDLVYYKTKDADFGKVDNCSYNFGESIRRTNQLVMRKTGKRGLEELEKQVERYDKVKKTYTLCQDDLVGFMAFATDVDLYRYQKVINKSIDCLYSDAYVNLTSCKIQTPQRIDNYQARLKEVKAIESVWKFLLARAKQYKRTSGEKNVKVSATNRLLSDDNLASDDEMEK